MRRRIVGFVVLVVVQLANVVLLARTASHIHFFSFDTVAAMIAVGSSSGYSGIVVAHELIHRPGRRWQSLGRLVLATVFYEHFFTEHLRGHHVRVGTDTDPATARFGESFNRFYARTVPAQFKSAWRLEAEGEQRELRRGRYRLGAGRSAVGSDSAD